MAVPDVAAAEEGEEEIPSPSPVTHDHTFPATQSTRMETRQGPSRDALRIEVGVVPRDPRMRPSWQGTRSADSQLVVVGSSAGGIEALSRVVGSLPPDFPAPIVIAQHLDPRRPSHLGEILARHATMPIKVVEGTASLEDGVIFVVPSNRLVEIVDGELRLRPAKPGSIAPSVDLLLETAAAAFGPGLIAVILTGSGSDGSAGAWQVKQAGGTVIIENPATALFPSMPRSISPSLVDATADLDSIGGVLLGILAADGTAPDGREAREFEALLDRIRERSGIDFSTYKNATIVRRLRGRMGATGHTLGGRLREAARDPTRRSTRSSSAASSSRSPSSSATRRSSITSANDHAADADRGGRRGRPPAAGLVCRLLDRRGGVFAGDHPPGGAR